MVHFQGRARHRRARRPSRTLPVLLIASANSAAGMSMYRSKGHFIVEGYEDDFDAGELQRLKRLFANGTDTSLVSVVPMCISCEGNINIDFEVLSETEAAAEVVNEQLRNHMPKDDLGQASLYVALTVVQRLTLQSVREVGGPAPPPQPPQPPQKPPQPPKPPQLPGEIQDVASTAVPRGKRWTLLLGLVQAVLVGLATRQVAW